MCPENTKMQKFKVARISNFWASTRAGSIGSAGAKVEDVRRVILSTESTKSVPTALSIKPDKSDVDSETGSNRLSVTLTKDPSGGKTGDPTYKIKVPSGNEFYSQTQPTSDFAQFTPLTRAMKAKSRATGTSRKCKSQ